MTESTDCIEPVQRPGAWAAMARDYAARGWCRPDIAHALCVEEATVDRLLADRDVPSETTAAGDTSERVSETEAIAQDAHALREVPAS